MRKQLMKYWFIMTAWIDTIFHTQTIQNQWIIRKLKNTKYVIFTNSYTLKKNGCKPSVALAGEGNYQ
ncbi:hypothetical protein C6497_13390 [Candidatus Poribacteria bacterium]|nr:MAG: hypothetical protein C6497_13390 [Candidatus Poribacteria bacterium]